MMKTYTNYKNKRTSQFGALDFETCTLEDGSQRAYYLLVYHPLRGYKHFKRCNYSTELEFNDSIIEYFKNNPSTYFSFNGKNFDHLLLNKILRQSGTIPSIWREKSSIRKMNWLGNTFLETLYWTHPCSLRDLAKTFLREDLKDKFPHDAVSPDMIVSPNSRFKELRKEDFKGFTDFDILKFSNKEFWPLVEEYILKDVQILHRSLLELDELYRKEIGYSVTDRNYHGIASISYDFVLKFIEKGDLVPFTREQQEKWKSCLMGGIVEVLDLNLKQETVHKYDINGLYSHVRLKDGFDYPIGEPELIVNPSVDRLKDLFGLIKATVYNDGLQRAYYLLVYHPLKVKSEEKFKSQHLLTLTGEQTTIEILGERKKAMGPGSLIDGKMYSKVRVRITTIQHLPILFQERNSYRS